VPLSLSKDIPEEIQWSPLQFWKEDTGY